MNRLVVTLLLFCLAQPIVASELRWAKFETIGEPGVYEPHEEEFSVSYSSGNVFGDENENIGTAYKVSVDPRVLLNKSNKVIIEFSRMGFDFPFKDDDRVIFARRSDGQILPIQSIKTKRGVITCVVGTVNEAQAGRYDLRLYIGGKKLSVQLPNALRVTPKIRVLLTFDDGPAVNIIERSMAKFYRLNRSELWTKMYGSSDSYPTPTQWVLDVLKDRGIKAAFFVLTTPDSYKVPLHDEITRDKANVQAGFDLLVREVKEGHVVAAHWGGEYKSQMVFHPTRTVLPPYDFNNDGTIDGKSALESDLLECMTTIQRAYQEAGMAEAGPQNVNGAFDWYLRPPVWKFKIDNLDARPTYEMLGLQMIMSDGKLYDGGYPGLGFSNLFGLSRGLKKAISRGIADINVTLHDSNEHTARDLEIVLSSIEKKMKSYGLVKDQDWRFTNSTEEVHEILRSRCHYLLGGAPARSGAKPIEGAMELLEQEVVSR